MDDLNYQSYLTEQETLEPESKPAAKKKLSLWDLLATMKFAIWILVLLGVLSLVSLFVGELLPKNEAGQATVQGTGRAVVDLFQMTDPFRSWWYRLLLGLLCLSLLACVLERTPVIWRLWHRKPPEDAGWLRNIRYGVQRVVTAPREDLEKHLGGGWDWRLKSDKLWVGERGRVGMWGPLLTHIGMLLIGVGALIGSFGGMTTRAGGYAADTIDAQDVPGLPFAVRIDSFRIQYWPLQPGQMVLVDNRYVGRLVKLEAGGTWLVEEQDETGKKTLSSNEPQYIRNQFNNNMDRGNIRKFASYVTILENGREMEKREIAVNAPLRRSGYRFYQSSYDPDNPRATATYAGAMISLTDSAKGITDSLLLKPGVETALPGDTLKVTAGQLLPHFKLGQNGPFSEDAEFVNPAVQLSFKGPHSYEKTQWVFLKFPPMQSGPGHFSYRVTRLSGEQASAELATIFEVKKTYGAWILWAGFLICSLGLVLCFYISHRVLYVEWPQAGQKEIRLTGLSRKTAHLFARQLDLMLEGLNSQAVS
ncbi:MAG TPA: cytochrome c biogenesis protein ResB [bacterium]|jgi:cytochrome c biogenesis protein